MPNEDETFMQLALDEGARGLGLTSPNPAVGAVVVQDGEVIGRGWHREAGGAHAEVEAIRDAVENGHSTDKATIYVTLEPCSTEGKTPPCVRVILDAGISRVVVGATDPNPAHAGAGFDELRNAGVEVATGVLEEEAMHPLRFFAKRITTGLPYLIAKNCSNTRWKNHSRTGSEPVDFQPAVSRRRPTLATAVRRHSCRRRNLPRRQSIPDSSRRI
ncbi:bifunctional diaminohydroxyphosphoribosylaminopyrimidine deaminase/5-amino-6-(5-phosphoribosylamino)uracil reductase RibD [bacterium]|nr:bifunctional diaminohydroxyphosphoribosylaminopyrimidine deaminase/5-amino-6-(5-phosphoribosylamino)uracil reductase RibD [bacterium]